MKKNWKHLLKTRMLAVGLAVVSLFTAVQPVQAADIDTDEVIVALGADLNAEQRASVLGLMGLTEADLENCTVLTITNAQEHKYLDAYVPADVIGSRSLSSVLVAPLEEGSGLDVTTYNISYCTISMYRNALLTAGLSDARVVVAAPTNISGTAALIGAVKAYETLTNEKVGDEVLETATNELVVTGELGDILGDSDRAAEIIAYVKQRLLESGASTPEEIEAIIREAAEKYDITLTEENIAQIRELMEKISKLDLDINALAAQAEELYNKIKDMGLDVNSAKVGNFFTNILNSVVDFFKGLFG